MLDNAVTLMQSSIYKHFLHSKEVSSILTGGKAAGVLSSITALKKLCNHPRLIWDSSLGTHVSSHSVFL